MPWIKMEVYNSIILLQFKTIVMLGTGKKFHLSQYICTWLYTFFTFIDSLQNPLFASLGF